MTKRYTNVQTVEVDIDADGKIRTTVFFRDEQPAVTYYVRAKYEPVFIEISR